MVGRGAVRAEQTVSAPLSATAAATEIAAALDAAHFGKSRPRAAARTIPFRPAFDLSQSQAAIAGMQERYGDEKGDGFKRVGICAQVASGFMQTLAIVAERGREKRSNIQRAVSGGL